MGTLGLSQNGLGFLTKCDVKNDVITTLKSNPGITFPTAFMILNVDF